MKTERKKGKKSKSAGEARKMWDPVREQIVDVDEGGFYHGDAYIKTGAGQKNGMPRYYLVLVPKRKIVHSEDIAKIDAAARVIACLEFDHAAEIEFFEAQGAYIVGSVCIDPEEIPLDFVELLIGMCGEIGIELHPDHMVTNLEKPTDAQVQKFLKRVSL